MKEHSVSTACLEATGIILAGGKSLRMGTEKALLHLGGETLLGRLADRMSAVFAEVVIVSRRPGSFRLPGTREVADIYTNMGPLAAIHAGLKASASNRSFVIACDMPFIDISLAAFMLENACGADIIVPKIGNYLEPLHAVYASSCLPAIEAALEQGCRKVTGIFNQVRVNHIDEETVRRFSDPKRTFLNLNTMQEYRRLRDSLCV